jgi:putative intracellular protease/amidase
LKNNTCSGVADESYFPSVKLGQNGQLITGQNPASSGPAARLLIDTLNKKAK